MSLDEIKSPPQYLAPLAKSQHTTSESSTLMSDPELDPTFSHPSYHDKIQQRRKRCECNRRCQIAGIVIGTFFGVLVVVSLCLIFITGRRMVEKSLAAATIDVASLNVSTKLISGGSLKEYDLDVSGSVHSSRGSKKINVVIGNFQASAHYGKKNDVIAHVAWPELTMSGDATAGSPFAASATIQVMSAPVLGELLADVLAAKVKKSEVTIRLTGDTTVTILVPGGLKIPYHHINVDKTLAVKADRIQLKLG